ncbi:MAG: SDR family NAD(P)-dependent oxidoreductase [Nitriliruptoraceae bacterium]
MEWTGSRVVVTGAAAGIGAAIARACAGAGAAAVLVADLDGDGASCVAASLQERGIRALARVVDVADPAAVTGMVAQAEEVFGGVDVMVSNAGIGTGDGVDASLDTWQRSYEVNVLAHVHAARAALPGMLARGRGAFVHTASAAGLLTLAGDAPYTVTKHAAVGFAEWLAVTYGGHGIQVSALCPQGVDTDLLRAADAGLAGRAVRAAGPVLSPTAVAAAVVEGVEAGRFLILPHPEVADHVRAKASDVDRWITAMQRLSGELES